MSSPSSVSDEIWEIIKKTEKNIESLFIAQKEFQVSQKELSAFFFTGRMDDGL